MRGIMLRSGAAHDKDSDDSDNHNDPLKATNATVTTTSSIMSSSTNANLLLSPLSSPGLEMLGSNMAAGSGGDVSASGIQHQLIQLRIKSFKDVLVTVRASDSIWNVKQVVLEALGKTSNDDTNKNASDAPYIRLIAAGRLLAPDTALIQDFAPTVQSGSVLHAVVVSNRSYAGAQAAAAAPVLSRRNALRGTGIDPAGWAIRNHHLASTTRDGPEDDDDDDDDSDNNSTGGTLFDVVYRMEEGRGGGSRRVRGGAERLGFDRLRDNLGLRRTEVTAIRSYFSRSVDRWIRQYPAAAEEAAGTETDLVRRRLMQEDAWMLLQGPASEFRLNVNASPTVMAAAAAATPSLARLMAAAAADAGPTMGSVNGPFAFRSVNNNNNNGAGAMTYSSVGTDRDFLWGFLLGFFVGSLMLVWVWMPTVPHKQKLGILTGISFQLALNMLRGSAHENGVESLAADDGVIIAFGD